MRYENTNATIENITRFLISTMIQLGRGCTEVLPVP